MPPIETLLCPFYELCVFTELCVLACVADALNLLYIAYKGFRRVRGPAATKAICVRTELSAV